MKEVINSEKELEVSEVRSSGKRPLYRVLVILAVLVIAGVAYFFASTPNNPQKEAEKEAQSIVAAVSKLMVLPTDEEPIIATVADPTKLEDQPFFANAKIGDKVLIFNVARKAILYRESERRIIDVAPLSPGQSPGSTTN